MGKIGKVLQDAFAAFGQAEADLARAIDANLTEQTRCAERRLSESHHAICNYPSRTAAELSAQMRFLIDRIADHSLAGTDSADYRELLNLVSNRIASIVEPAPAPQAAGVEPEAPAVINHDPMDLLSVVDMVTRSSDRMSIISTDYRYLHTSIGNSKFYNAGPGQIAGRHLGEMIGATRFESRARDRLDACFAQGSQDYSHALEVNGRHLILNCRMTPLRDRHNALVGALVTMRDMTSHYLGHSPG
jgi:hypothetical protein